ncbi:MAG: hypothetical protein FJ291_09675 [Planctomycetes bacterium]|nr:hypothetical protein [Planctomycetota bacterium]
MVRTSYIVLAATLGLCVLGAAAVAVYAACGHCGAPTTPARVEVKPEVKVLAEVKVKETPPFDVLDVTGPNKDKERVCYICTYGGRPSFVILTRALGGHFGDLVKALDKFVCEHGDKRMAGFVAYLGANSEENREALRKLAKDLSLTIPLTIALDGEKGPGAYKLDGHFDTVVLVCHKDKVERSFILHCETAACTSKECMKLDSIVEAGTNMLKGI